MHWKWSTELLLIFKLLVPWEPCQGFNTSNRKLETRLSQTSCHAVKGQQLKWREISLWKKKKKKKIG